MKHTTYWNSLFCVAVQKVIARLSSTGMAFASVNRNHCASWLFFFYCPGQVLAVDPAPRFFDFHSGYSHWKECNDCGFVYSIPYGERLGSSSHAHHWPRVSLRLMETLPFCVHIDFTFAAGWTRRGGKWNGLLGNREEKNSTKIRPFKPRLNSVPDIINPLSWIKAD